MELGVLQLALGVACGAGKVGSTLHELFQNVKKDKENALAFAREVQELAAACSNVGGLIQECQANPIKNLSIKRGLEHFWDGVKKSLEGCHSTVMDLEVAATDRALTSKKSLNIFARVVIQIKKEKKTKELQEVRNRVQTHTASLQLALNVLQVRLVFSTPDLIIEKFESRVVDFVCRRKMLVDLVSKRKELEGLRSRRSPREQPFVGKSEWDLLTISDETINSAKRQYADSVASFSGSTNSAPPTSSASFRQIGPAAPSRIGAWVQDQGAVQRLMSEPSTPRTETSSVFSRPLLARNGSTADTFITESRSAESPHRQTGRIDHYSDDEAEVDDLQNAIDDARSFFLEANYREASARLQVAERGIAKLPSRRQRLIRPFELQYMLATCAFYIRPPAKAAELLDRFLEQDFASLEARHSPNGDTARDQSLPDDISKRLQVQHLLAITHFRLGNLQHARTSCKIAREGRRRHHRLGKTHPSYYESSALMAVIERADGHPDEADNIVSAIKDPRRDDIIQGIADATAREAEPAESTIESVSAYQVAEGHVNVEREPEIAVDPNDASSHQGINLGLRDCTINQPQQHSDSLKDYANFHSYDLARLARSMDYHEPSPASRETRKAWADYLEFQPNRLNPLSQALFSGNLGLAMGLTQPRHMTLIAAEDLHIAALFGDWKVVDGLCRHRLKVEHQWKTAAGTLTALHCAAIGGNRQIADVLMSKGCPINQDLPGFGTPLALAALGQRLDIIDLLLSHRARGSAGQRKFDISLDAGCDTLGSIVHSATMSRNKSLLETLVDNKPLLETSQTIYPARVRELRKRLDMLSGTSTTNSPEEAASASNLDNRIESIRGHPLAVASYFGCEAAVEYLCAHGHSDVTALCSASLWHKGGPSSGIEHHNALTLASMQGNEMIRALLISKGAHAETPHVARRELSFSSRGTR